MFCETSPTTRLGLALQKPCDKHTGSGRCWSLVPTGQCLVPGWPSPAHPTVRRMKPLCTSLLQGGRSPYSSHFHAPTSSLNFSPKRELLLKAITSGKPRTNGSCQAVRVTCSIRGGSRKAFPLCLHITVPETQRFRACVQCPSR